MLRAVHEAEDASQQVFLSAYQALLGGASVREPGGWLAAIARNECRARVAAGMRRPLPVADEDLDALPSAGDELARRSHVEELRAGLAALPERQREAFVLRYLYGLRYGEVATALGLSRPATEALLFRARRAVRRGIRPVVGGALAVPSALRDELAMALPGFDGGAGSRVAAGLTGGLLLKLAAGPLGVKAATAVVAVTTVGIVGAMPHERGGPSGLAEPAPFAEEDVGVDLSTRGARAGAAQTDSDAEADGGSQGRISRESRERGRPSGRGEGRSADRGAGSGSNEVPTAPGGDGGAAGDDGSPSSSEPSPGATPSGEAPPPTVAPPTDDPTTSGGSSGGGSDGSGTGEPEGGMDAPSASTESGGSSGSDSRSGDSGSGSGGSDSSGPGSGTGSGSGSGSGTSGSGDVEPDD
jgi:RNA polymerase sigma factor (sigma-70 family)